MKEVEREPPLVQGPHLQTEGFKPHRSLPVASFRTPSSHRTVAQMDSAGALL